MFDAGQKQWNNSTPQQRVSPGITELLSLMTLKCHKLPPTDDSLEFKEMVGVNGQVMSLFPVSEQDVLL